MKIISTSLAALILSVGAYAGWYSYDRAMKTAQVDKCNYLLDHPKPPTMMTAPDGSLAPVYMLETCTTVVIPPSLWNIVRGHIVFEGVPERMRVNPYTLSDVLFSRYTLGPNIDLPCDQRATTTDCSILLQTTSSASSSTSQSLVRSLGTIDFDPEQMFKQSPMYRIGHAPLSVKYKNDEMGFSLMFPEGVTVKTQGTFPDGLVSTVFMDEPGYEESFNDLWYFNSDGNNPARNAAALSIEDYEHDYPAPDASSSTIVIHKTSRVSANVIYQEYSYGYWEPYVNGERIFLSGVEGCDMCYRAWHFVRYVYFDPLNKRFVILERRPLTDEFYLKAPAYQLRDALADKIARSLKFE